MLDLIPGRLLHLLVLPVRLVVDSYGVLWFCYSGCEGGLSGAGTLVVACREFCGRVSSHGTGNGRGGSRRGNTCLGVARAIRGGDLYAVLFLLDVVRGTLYTIY